MKRSDWLFIFLLSFILITFFNTEESVFAKEEKSFFISFKESDLFRPYPKKNINLDISASSYISFLVDGKEKILFSKNIEEQRSIASLTKLMTAVIVLENYNLEEKVSVSDSAIKTFGIMGELKSGDVLKIKDLLEIMLIESSNDAAESLAEKMGRDNFIKLMNQKANQLGMKNTLYTNPSGLDFDYSNISTVSDLKKIVAYIIKEYPLITEILSIKEKDLYNNNIFHHKMISTNILLYENNGYVWGKTGYTVKAGECIILLMKRPFSNNKNSYIINIIINSKDRFRDARIMEEKIKESFYW